MRDDATRPYIVIRIERQQVRWLAALAILLAVAGVLSSETLTFTTYYPAPAGVYRRLTSTGEAVFARDEGKVGVGTASPLEYGKSPGRLDVNGYAAARDLWLKDSGRWASQGGASFGEWQAFSINTVYLAPSDGFVLGTARSGSNGYISCYSGPTSPPTLRHHATNAADQDINCVTPVRKGDHWQVGCVTTCSNGKVFFIPFGS